MARLRYNGLTATLGADLTSGGTTITFAAALTSAAGSVPTISGSDTLALSIFDATGAVSEIVSLTAYTSGATTGTISRGQEGTTAAAHTAGAGVVHGLTVADVTSLAASGGDTTWTAPTLINSWVNFGAPYANAGYRKDSNGIVHLRGLVKNGVAGSNIFVLPADYRPPFEVLMATDSNSRPANIIVRTTGEVVNNVGGTTYYSLEGIHFYTT